MERVGSLYRSGGLVFADEVGGILNPSNLRNRSLKALLKRAELAPIRFHDLRRTCATLLLTKGMHAKYVQELLDTYSHVLSGMGGAIPGAMDEALG